MRISAGGNPPRWGRCHPLLITNDANGRHRFPTRGDAVLLFTHDKAGNLVDNSPLGPGAGLLAPAGGQYVLAC